MIGRTNVGGSGGSLGVSVVNGTKRPANPSNNLVWVNTGYEVKSYVLSGVQPETPANGMLWLSIADSGGIKVATTVGNDWITLYFLSAKLYVSGEWQMVEAQIYQNGVWTALLNGNFLYNAGNEFESITGGWTGTALKKSSDTTAVKPTITKGETSLTMTASAGKGGVVHTTNKIDLSGKTKLEFAGTIKPAATSGYWTIIGVWTEFGGTYQANLAAVLDVTSEKTGTQTLDISGLDGEYYVGFALHGSSTIEMNSLKIE